MRSAAVLAALGLALLGFSALSLTNASAANQTIDAGNVYFCSSAFQDGVCETNITAGDTITWSVSAGIHTVTECDASHTVCPPPGGGFDSGQDPLGVGQTFAFTFATPGTYNYYCAIHPSDMRGRVIVAAQVTPAPTPTPAPTSPGATAAPTTAAPAQTAVPASVPKTGGPPAEDSASLWLLLIGAGATMLVASGGLVFATTVRKR